MYDVAANAYVAQLHEITVTTRDTFESRLPHSIRGDLALAAGTYQEAAPTVSRCLCVELAVW